MSKTIRRHSRVLTDLPPELRAEVDRLLLEPGVTYDDVQEHLVSKGYDISRSSIGRYGKEYLESYQKLKIAIDQAKAMKGEVGEGLALEEAVANLALQQAMQGLMSGTIQVAEVPKLLGEIGKLQASGVQREKLKIEVDKRVKEALQDAADVVKKTATKAGASDELIERIRADILGIGAPA